MAWRRDLSLRQEWPALALLAAALLLIAPLWCVSSPAMPDYPAHLASFYLIGGGVRNVARFYHLQWSFVPNLAAEILVPLLARLTGLAVAARLFLSAGIALWVLGPGAIQRALYGRIGIAPLFGAVFAYNANLMWGFFNYYFAAGLSLAVFAAWVATRGQAGLKRSFCFMLAVIAVYFCHVFAAVTLLAMMGCFELADAGWKPRQWFMRALTVAAIFLPAALAFLFLKPAGIADGRLEFNLAATALDRFESLTLHAFDDPAYVLPIALGVFLLLALLLRMASIKHSMLLALAVLLAGALVAPEWAMGGWAVHLRLPAFFCVVLFASVELRFGKSVTALLAAAALILLGATAFVLARNWDHYDRQFREFRSALRAMPHNQRLLTVLDGDAIGMASDQPYWHMAEFAIIDRGDATALMFTTRGQHVVQMNPPLDRFAAATAQQGSPPDISELNDLAAGQMNGDVDIRDVFPYLMRFPCHYDEAVVVHLGGKRSPVPPMFTLRHAGSFFALYDIKRDTCVKQS